MVPERYQGLLLPLLPPATKLGQGNIFTGICDSVCLSASWDTAPPRSRHPSPREADTHREQAPPEADPPQKQTPPAQSMLGDMVNAQVVRILLECNLVFYCAGPVPCAAPGSGPVQGYKLTHITFTPYTATPSSIPHSMVQVINKEMPFSTAASMAEPQVPPYKIRTCLPIANS